MLTAELFGTLPAFPNASMDVILDVRDRLAGARAAFRGATAASARELEAGLKAGESVPALMSELRRREIDPAIEGLKSRLQELGAQDTLLRVASDARVIGTTLTIGIAGTSGLTDLGVAVAAGLVAPPVITAAIAREVVSRRRVRRELALTPYWMLYEADRLTRATS